MSDQKPELFNICDYCSHCFAECKSNPKFLIDHPNVDLYQEKYPDLMYLNDLIYECDSFKLNKELVK